MIHGEEAYVEGVDMLRAIRTALRTVDHEEQLTTVGHLDELRTRVIASLAVIAVAFGVCFWQNHRLLHLIDRPLAHQTQEQVRAGQGPLGATYTVSQGARDVAVQLRAVVGVLAAPGAPVAPAAFPRPVRCWVLRPMRCPLGTRPTGGGIDASSR